MKAHVKKKVYKAYIREQTLAGLVNDPITGQWISQSKASTTYRLSPGCYKYNYEGTAKTKKR